MLEDYCRLDNLELDTEGTIQLEVVSTRPAVHPISAFLLPDEETYTTESYVITVKVKDGVLQYFLISCCPYFQWFLTLRFL